MQRSENDEFERIVDFLSDQLIYCLCIGDTRSYIVRLTRVQRVTGSIELKTGSILRTSQHT